MKEAKVPWDCELLDITQAADAAGVNKDVVREWLKNGLGSSKVRGLKLPRIRRGVLAEYIKGFDPPPVDKK